MERGAFGVDVGGTAIKSWSADGPGRSIPTPQGDVTGERTAAAIADLVAARDEPVTALGVAVPGVVDDAAGVCRFSMNLGWREVPIRALLQERTGLPVAVTHDVRAGAVAERLTGAGAGRPGSLLFAPIGTGLAIATVDDDGLPAGSMWAGEVGQLRYPSGPHRGLRVEEVASAGGLAKRYGAPDAATVAVAMAAGDARAALLWAETVEAVAEVLAWASAVTAPSTIAIGGGMVLAGDLLFEPLDRALRLRLGDLPVPALLRAQHGPSAGSVGAALLAARL